MPLLIQSLSCEDVGLRKSTLQIFQTLITESHETVTPILSSLIPLLINLCQKNSTLNNPLVYSFFFQ